MAGSISYRVQVSKDYTVFAAGHFITYDGGRCEPLHGHNYRAAVGLEGDLDENAYVINFVLLKRLLRGLCDRLDHRMLLPTGNPLMIIERQPESYVVRALHKTYVFPAEDVVQLPIPNTTSECLAEWLSGELLSQLGDVSAGLNYLEVAVEETAGQQAVCRRALR